MQMLSIILGRLEGEELPSTTEKFLPQNAETKDEWLFMPSPDAVTASLL